MTLVCAQGISALAANDLDVSALEKTVTLKAETLDAVPAEGTELGTVSFSDPTDGTELGTVALVASNDVQLDEPEPQPAAPVVQQVQATVIEPEPAPEPQPEPQVVAKPSSETSTRREKPAGKTKAIERHRPGRVRMGLGLIGLGLKTLITGKTK